MNSLVPWIWAAGGAHLLIAAANLALPRQLQYRANLALVSPIVRQIFNVHSAYIVMTLIAFSGLCFFFAPDLAGGSLLGTSLSWYMAVFWLSRLFIQVFYYDPELKRQHPVANLAFTLAVAYLGGVSALAALGVAK